MSNNSKHRFDYTHENKCKQLGQRKCDYMQSAKDAVAAYEKYDCLKS
jgi:hypothetical protein